MSTLRLVRLVLGGGGGKGIVHIGVIKAVVDLGFDISSITGTSIGAVWAAVFARMLILADGPPADRRQQAVHALEATSFDLTFRRFRDYNLRSLLTDGLFKGDLFEASLETMLWPHSAASTEPLTFSQLDFDLTVTATNALTGSPLIFNKTTAPGLSIARAVRASMSIPLLFKQVTVEIPDGTGGMRAVSCWDGGTTGNCRFDLAARELPSLPVIASSLTYRGEPVLTPRTSLGFLLRIRDTYDQAINCLLRQTEELLLEQFAERQPRILLLRPPLSSISTFALDLSSDLKARAIAAAYRYSCEYISSKLGALHCSGD